MRHFFYALTLWAIGIASLYANTLYSQPPTNIIETDPLKFCSQSTPLADQDTYCYDDFTFSPSGPATITNISWQGTDHSTGTFTIEILTAQPPTPDSPTPSTVVATYSFNVSDAALTKTASGTPGLFNFNYVLPTPWNVDTTANPGAYWIGIWGVDTLNTKWKWGTGTLGCPAAQPNCNNFTYAHQFNVGGIPPWQLISHRTFSLNDSSTAPTAHVTVPQTLPAGEVNIPYTQTGRCGVVE